MLKPAFNLKTYTYLSHLIKVLKIIESCPKSLKIAFKYLDNVCNSMMDSYKDSRHRTAMGCRVYFIHLTFLYWSSSPKCEGDWTISDTYSWDNSFNLGYSWNHFIYQSYSLILKRSQIYRYTQRNRTNKDHYRGSNSLKIQNWRETML